MLSTGLGTGDAFVNEINRSPISWVYLNLVQGERKKKPK